jgi:predicted nucleic acid-binding protein
MMALAVGSRAAGRVVAERRARFIWLFAARQDRRNALRCSALQLKWRLLVEDGRKVGHTYSQPDLTIAATALHHGLTVVSRDTSDFNNARVPVLNP